jgi:hypothetical protein
MDQDAAAAARSRVPPDVREDEGREAGAANPSSDAQRTPPKGAFRCGARDHREGLTGPGTFGWRAMGTRAEQQANRTATGPSALGPAGGGANPAALPPPALAVDPDAGRVLVRDGGRTTGYELRMRDGRGRCRGLGWVELALWPDGLGDRDGRVGGRGDRGGGRRRPRARGGRAEPLGGGRVERPQDAAARSMGRRLRCEVERGLELERVSLRAVQALIRARLEAGEPLVSLCLRGGFVDRDGRIDTTWLERRAGLRPERWRSGKLRLARTARYEVFLRLARAVDADPGELGV